MHAREQTCKSVLSQDTPALLLYLHRCAVSLADSICLFYLWGKKKHVFVSSAGAQLSFWIFDSIRIFEISHFGTKEFESLVILGAV